MGKETKEGAEASEQSTIRLPRTADAWKEIERNAGLDHFNGSAPLPDDKPYPWLEESED